jgi:hypothetical protein
VTKEEVVREKNNTGNTERKKRKRNGRRNKGTDIRIIIKWILK